MPSQLETTIDQIDAIFDGCTTPKQNTWAKSAAIRLVVASYGDEPHPIAMEYVRAKYTETGSRNKDDKATK